MKYKINKKLYVDLIIIFLITFCLFSFTSCDAHKSPYSGIQQSENTTSNNNTNSNKEIEKGIDDIKKIITTDSPITIDNINEIDNFINKYKDEYNVKNELRDFIVNKANEYLNNSTKNKNLWIKLDYALERLHADYKDDDKVDSLVTEFKILDYNINHNINTNTTSQQTQQTQQPNSLTSQDGNLELLDYSNSDGNIIGTIKNNSNFAYSYVEVDINLLDANGNQVGSTLANVNNLQANSTWKFKAVVLVDSVKTFKIIKITGIK